MELIYLKNEKSQIIYIPELETAVYFDERIKGGKLGQRRTKKLKEEFRNDQTTNYTIDEILARRISDLATLQTGLYQDLKRNREDLEGVVKIFEDRNERKSVVESFESELKVIENEIDENYKRIFKILEQSGIS